MWHSVRRCALLFAVLWAVSAPAAGAPVNTARTQIVFLGTSGGPPLVFDRSKPSALLIVDGRYYLVDCGIGTAGRLVEARIDSNRIQTVFLTHLHADHDLGLADMMANDFFERARGGAAEPVSIYGPPQTRALIDAAFNFLSVGFRPFASENPGDYPKVGARFVSPFVVHEIDRGGVVFKDDKIRVTAVENAHYALMPSRDRQAFKSYSYRIETPDGVILFTGDTGPSEAVAQLARNADVLIAEASYLAPEQLDRLGVLIAARSHWAPARTKAWRDHSLFEHLDPEQVGRLGSKADARAVILYHYDPTSKAEQDAYVSGVKQYFKGPVFAPDDLDRYCLNSGVVAPCGSARRR
jgi:ribonuclease BN (tRNA processing enzyme)